MNKTDLDRLSAKVVAAIADLETTAASARTQVQESSETIPNILQDGIGAAQGGIDLQNALKVHQHCSTQIALLRNALLRMDRGSFGICQDCQCEIGLRRLEAVPGAVFCIHCQEDGERRIVPAPRPTPIPGYPESWWAA